MSTIERINAIFLDRIKAQYMFGLQVCRAGNTRFVFYRQSGSYLRSLSEGELFNEASRFISLHTCHGTLPMPDFLDCTRVPNTDMYEAGLLFYQNPPQEDGVENG